MDPKGDLSLKRNHTIDRQTARGARRYDRKIAGATVVVHYPKGSSYDEHGVLTPNPELAKRLAHKLESSGAVAIPRDVAQLLETAGLESPGWKIELLSDGGSLQSGFTGRLEYLDKLKVRGILAPERTVLEGHTARWPRPRPTPTSP